MPTKMSSIIRGATRTPVEKLNILTFPTHERYETMLCKTGHNFYAYRAEGIKAAFDLAKKDDIVAILGKGREEYQDIAGEKIFFSDREVIREYQ